MNTTIQQHVFDKVTTGLNSFVWNSPYDSVCFVTDSPPLHLHAIA
jgi:hypothetical protein